MTADPHPGPLTGDEIIALLGLRPLVGEGGYFAETLRSGRLPAEALPDHPGDRSAKTAIYYLLTPDTVSAMHRLPGPELFHHYAGDSVRQLQLAPDGTGRVVRLGSDLRAGDRPQQLVPAGHWQGARLLPGPHGFALMGTTMSPGFDPADWVGGARDALAEAYPAFAEEIARLTPGDAGT